MSKRDRKLRTWDGPYNGETRQSDGLTVFASRDDGKCIALTRKRMPLRDALRSVCAALDTLPGSWRIDCISTPSTIIRDMQGHREIVNAHDERLGPRTAYPEPQMLANIGRRDLWRAP